MVTEERKRAAHENSCRNTGMLRWPALVDGVKILRSLSLQLENFKLLDGWISLRLCTTDILFSCGAARTLQCGLLELLSLIHQWMDVLDSVIYSGVSY